MWNLFTDRSAGNELLGKLRKMRMLADDDDEATPAAGSSGQTQSQQPAWMRNLHDRCREWLQQIPAVSSPMWWSMSGVADSLS